MGTVGVIAFSFLLTTALSAPVKNGDHSVTLFYGEDFHIPMPSLAVDVTFRNRSSPRAGEVFVMRGGIVVHGRAKVNRHLSHLIIDSVEEWDEGLYTVKDPADPEDIMTFMLIVRDCSNEQIIKYGDNYHIALLGVTPPITLEYKPSAVEAKMTSRPAVVLLTLTGKAIEGYHGRISVNERHVTLRAVTGTDEGSYTVRDSSGNVRKKECLNVKEHIYFETLPYGEKLKINLILNSSLVDLYYTREKDPTRHLLLDHGEFTDAKKDLGLENRLSMEGSSVYLDQVKGADVGQFEITDTLGFTVSTVHLEMQPYKLESVYVAIIALLGLLVFLLLVCLLSCLIKVKKRAKRAAALKKIAQDSGKEDEGEAFRQVVKNITKLSEDSKHSQADNTEKSQSTEVDIKGLEVSSKEVGVGNLDTSDSGVGFNTALPLDTDTDAPDQNLDSLAVSVSVDSETKPCPPPATAESKPSTPPAAKTKASPSPEIKKTPQQPLEPQLDVPKPADSKLIPASSPEPKAGLSPADPKPPPSPSPEPKPAAPEAATPTPESKGALTPKAEHPKPTTPESKGALTPKAEHPKPTTPESKGALTPKAEHPKPTTPESKGALTPKAEHPKPTTPESKGALTPKAEHPKPTTPEPITNGTPEPGEDSKPSPNHADIIGAPKAAPPKTPEAEQKSGGAALEASKDDTAAEDSNAST
ncbi:uncharacterized protein si:dkeyp-77h1.4 isoform X2 [Pungitius pungitius]|uniref:uncharacterized protein si:dkeyp-77h1.4 isoform X2 n=1 Tax=Pungitius pungitius TaxID=134920 RepID=UPI002E1430C3